MSEVQIKLTGWKAAVVVIAVALLCLYGLMTRDASLDAQAGEVLKAWIGTQYMGEALAKYQINGKSNFNEETAEQGLNELLAAGDITFPSIKARGKKRNVVVRVEVLVDGNTPPDGKCVRYFSMNHSSAIGWTMNHETFWTSYFIKIF